MKKSIITLLIAATLLSSVVTAAPVQMQRFSDCESECLELCQSQSLPLVETVECGDAGDDALAVIAIFLVILFVAAAASAS